MPRDVTGALASDHPAYVDFSDMEPELPRKLQSRYVRTRRVPRPGQIGLSFDWPFSLIPRSCPDVTDAAWYEQCRQDVIDSYHQQKATNGSTCVRRVAVTERFCRHESFRGGKTLTFCEFGDSRIYPPFDLPEVWWFGRRPVVPGVRWQDVTRPMLLELERAAKRAAALARRRRTQP